MACDRAAGEIKIVVQPHDAPEPDSGYLIGSGMADYGALLRVVLRSSNASCVSSWASLLCRCRLPRRLAYVCASWPRALLFSSCRPGIASPTTQPLPCAISPASRLSASRWVMAPVR
jgi:hypothetical protein